MLHSLHLRVILVSLLTAPSAIAADFYVAPEGVDAADRDGRSEQRAWASLAYACDRVEAGAHVIHVLPGEYVATRTAYPNNGVAVVGRQRDGKDVTRIIASKDWELPPLKDYEGHEIAVSHNLFVNFRNVPEGNFEGELPDLEREGGKPAPFYLPATEASNVVDRGVDVGLPFHGRAPDLGALEWGAEPWTLGDIPEPR